MPQNAWSLLVFTLLSQLSVGAYCVAEFLNYFYSKEFGAVNLRSLRLFSRKFVLITAILAGISSMFHLGNWAHAYHAFNNLKTSWVSREMVFFLLFIACVAFLAFMSSRKSEAFLLQRVVGILGAFCGITLIFSMARIYMLPTVPVWNAWTTPALFFTTALILGSLAVVCFYKPDLSSSKTASLRNDLYERWNRKTRPNLVKFLLILIVTGTMVTGFFFYRTMTVMEGHGTETSVGDIYKQLFFSFTIFLNIFGWGLLFIMMKKSDRIDGLQDKSSKLVYSAFIIIALSEIVGRYLFYVSFLKTGL